MLQHEADTDDQLLTDYVKLVDLQFVTTKNFSHTRFSTVEMASDMWHFVDRMSYLIDILAFSFPETLV